VAQGSLQTCHPHMGEQHSNTGRCFKAAGRGQGAHLRVPGAHADDGGPCPVHGEERQGDPELEQEGRRPPQQQFPEQCGTQRHGRAHTPAQRHRGCLRAQQRRRNASFLKCFLTCWTHVLACVSVRACVWSEYMCVLVINLCPHKLAVPVLLQLAAACP